MLPKYHFLLLLLLPVLCWTACEKSIFNPQPAAKVLPPITMTGAGTFGCKINGEVFLHTPKAFDDHIYVEYNPRSSKFQLFAIESVDNSYHRNISIVQYNVLDTGAYTLTKGKYNILDSECMTIHGLTEEHFVLDEPNEITISRFDSEERIISGTFRYTLYSEACQDTFRITEGRFDMPWLK
ncbi:MAG: hypothetical protein ACRBG0_14815 [Lewinella sp.]|uniref:hypothetical protein n=1 Tax=Lewinella sp. TaxID=2004506 RepID=UPI003D6A2134